MVSAGFKLWRTLLMNRSSWCRFLLGLCNWRLVSFLILVYLFIPVVFVCSPATHWFVRLLRLYQGWRGLRCDSCGSRNPVDKSTCVLESSHLRSAWGEPGCSGCAAARGHQLVLSGVGLSPGLCPSAERGRAGAAGCGWHEARCGFVSCPAWALSSPRCAGRWAQAAAVPSSVPVLCRRAHARAVVSDGFSGLDLCSAFPSCCSSRLLVFFVLSVP